MTEARFLVDSLGEAAQSPDFDGCMLDVAGNARLGIEAERIESAKLAVWGSRALRRAEVRIQEGLLLDAAPEDREAAQDAALKELPTEEFEIVAAESDDPERMDRIKAARQAKKQANPTLIDRSTSEGRQRWERRHEEARRRLDGRQPSSSKRFSKRK